MSENVSDGAGSPARRSVRSFSLRQGRITSAQQKALETLWPLYGLEIDDPFDPGKIWRQGQDVPVIVEIGFGNGESLMNMAAMSPHLYFVGIEVHRPGVGHLLLGLKERKLDNVRVYCADAVSVLQHTLPDASIVGLHVFFPDPWPKKRHHKRRLVNAEFITLAAQKLKKGGLFHTATDWEEYAQQMLDLLEKENLLYNQSNRYSYARRPPYRPVTKFETRGQTLGHGVWDLIFVRQ